MVGESLASHREEKSMKTAASIRLCISVLAVSLRGRRSKAPTGVADPRRPRRRPRRRSRCRRDDDCDDSNPCTKDKCNRNAGRKLACEFKPRDTRHGDPSLQRWQRLHSVGQLPGGVARAPTPCTSGPAISATSRDVRPGHGCLLGPHVPDRTACNDADACTRSGLAARRAPARVRTRSSASASDQCHEAGTCDPASGACSDPAAPDGTACTDTVSCSGPDVCDAGVCGHNGNPRPLIVFASGQRFPRATVNSGSRSTRWTRTARDLASAVHG